MKRYSISLALSVAALASTAQNKLDWYAIDALEDFHATAMEEATIASAMSSGVKMVDVFVTVTNASDFAKLEAMGYEVNVVTDEIAIVNMPFGQLEALCMEPWVVHAALGGEARPMLDMARRDTGVDDIHAGTDAELGRAYTGKGVVVGLYDTGLDPNHVNFLTPDLENTRVQGIWHNGAVYEGAQIFSFTTDNIAQIHGTHVLGIAAGGYMGEANYAGTVAPTTGKMPYYGVAYDSDIVIGCGSISDANIIKGVQYIASRAKELGEPAVINLSLGNNRGPHDGSDAFGRSLDALAKENLIVVSAGNEGRKNMGLTKVLTEDDPYLRTFPVPCSASNRIITTDNHKGLVEIYGSDERPFKCTIAVYAAVGGLTGRIIDSYTVEESTSGRRTKIGGTAAGADVKLSGFDSATSAASYLTIASNVSTISKRYNVQINHALAYPLLANDFYIAIIIEGYPGQRINMYAHSNVETSDIYSMLTSHNIDGYESSTPDGTINNNACAPNLLAIGAYVTRTNWRTYPTGSGLYSGTLNTIAEFSSWGTMYDGSTLPHVLAPGSSLASSVNGYNSEYVSKTTGITGFLAGGGRNYHWNNFSGTSMAAPFATGVFGLWLEADPTLTSADVKSILAATSKVDVHLMSLNPAQYGAGKLDAIAGLKEVIRRRNAGMDNIIADTSDTSLIVENLGAGNYSVFLAGGDGLTATVYNLAGAQVASARADSDSLTLDASSLQPGIYVLKAVNGSAAASTKIVIR